MKTQFTILGKEVIKTGSYHRIWCPYLTGTVIEGYNRIEFRNKEGAKYKNIPACYYCMIRATDPSLKYAIKYEEENKPYLYNLNKRKVAYYTAIAREKYNFVKASKFINGSRKAYRITYKKDLKK